MPKILDLKDRVAYLLEQGGYNFNSLANKIGSNRQTVKNIIDGVNKPGYEFIDSLKIAFPDLSFDWLFTGEGEPFKSTNHSIKPYEDLGERPPMGVENPKKELQDYITGKNLRVLTEVVDLQGNTLIPMLDIKAAAGYPANIDNPTYISTLPMVSRPEPEFSRGTWIRMEIDGDSMSPTMDDREWFYCQYVQNWREDIRDDRIYMVVLRDGCVVKRIYNRMEKENSLALSSDNTYYRPVIRHATEILQVWRVFEYNSHDLSNKALQTRHEVANMRIELEDYKNQLNAQNTAIQRLEQKFSDIIKLLPPKK